MILSGKDFQKFTSSFYEAFHRTGKIEHAIWDRMSRLELLYSFMTLNLDPGVRVEMLRKTCKLSRRENKQEKDKRQQRQDATHTERASTPDHVHAVPVCVHRVQGSIQINQLLTNFGK